MAKLLTITLALLAASASAAPTVDVYALKNTVMQSEVVQAKIQKSCQTHKIDRCEERAGDALFCQLLQRSHADLAAEHCGSASAKPQSFLQVVSQRAPEDELAKE